jgi:hypothetical protein
MTAFSPVSAALEGFRVMRREPKAALFWLGIWVASLCIVTTSTSLVGRVVAPTGHPQSGLLDLAKRLGPAVVVLLLSLVTTTTAIFRAVLTPEERQVYFVRLGLNEARVFIAVSISVLLAPVVIGVITYLLYVIASPIMSVAPGYLREIAFVGAAITTAVLVWVFVRLSLIPVETFDEHRFHLTAYWPITSGFFWSLLGAYTLWGIISTVLSTALTAIVVFLSSIVFSLGRPHNFQIGLVLLIVPIVFLLALAFMLPWLLLCACQAYAYRAIVAARSAAASPA